MKRPKKKKEFEWDISPLQDLALVLTIFRKMPSRLQVVRQGEKGSYRYFIDGKRLPKETLMELFKFLNVLYPRYESITDDLLETDPIEIAEDSFFTYAAPFFRQ